MTSHHVKKRQDYQCHLSVADYSDVGLGVEWQVSILPSHKDTVVEKTVPRQDDRFEILSGDGP